MKTLTAIIESNVDTSSNWNELDPIIPKNMLVLESDTLHFVIGDGVTSYTGLNKYVKPYMETKADLELTNPVLPHLVEVYESDTGASKIGDGDTPWNELEYNINSLTLYAQAAAGGFAGTEEEFNEALTNLDSILKVAAFHASCADNTATDNLMLTQNTNAVNGSLGKFHGAIETFVKRIQFETSILPYDNMVIEFSCDRVNWIDISYGIPSDFVDVTVSLFDGTYGVGLRQLSENKIDVIFGKGPSVNNPSWEVLNFNWYWRVRIVRARQTNNLQDVSLRDILELKDINSSGAISFNATSSEWSIDPVFPIENSEIGDCLVVHKKNPLEVAWSKQTDRMTTINTLTPTRLSGLYNLVLENGECSNFIFDRETTTLKYIPYAIKPKGEIISSVLNGRSKIIPVLNYISNNNKLELKVDDFYGYDFINEVKNIKQIKLRLTTTNSALVLYDRPSKISVYGVTETKEHILVSTHDIPWALSQESATIELTEELQYTAVYVKFLAIAGPSGIAVKQNIFALNDFQFLDKDGLELIPRRAHPFIVSNEITPLVAAYPDGLSVIDLPKESVVELTEEMSVKVDEYRPWVYLLYDTVTGKSSMVCHELPLRVIDDISAEIVESGSADVGEEAEFYSIASSTKNGVTLAKNAFTPSTTIYTETESWQSAVNMIGQYIGRTDMFGRIVSVGYHNYNVTTNSPSTVVVEIQRSNNPAGTWEPLKTFTVVSTAGAWNRLDLPNYIVPDGAYAIRIRATAAATPANAWFLTKMYIDVKIPLKSANRYQLVKSENKSYFRSEVTPVIPIFKLSSSVPTPPQLATKINSIAGSNWGSSVAANAFDGVFTTPWWSGVPNTNIGVCWIGQKNLTEKITSLTIYNGGLTCIPFTTVTEIQRSNNPAGTWEAIGTEVWKERVPNKPYEIILPNYIVPPNPYCMRVRLITPGRGDTTMEIMEMIMTNKESIEREYSLFYMGNNYWESGWVPVSINGTYILNHSLGTTDISLETYINSEQSTERMRLVGYEHNGGSTIGCHVEVLSDTQLKITTGTAHVAYWTRNQLSDTTSAFLLIRAKRNY